MFPLMDQKTRALRD